MGEHCNYVPDFNASDSLQFDHQSHAVQGSCQERKSNTCKFLSLGLTIFTMGTIWNFDQKPILSLDIYFYFNMCLTN